MAVTATILRSSHSDTTTTSQEFCTLSLSGTYATGGFTIKPFGVYGGPGSSPLAGGKVLGADFYSPLGYIYRQTTTGTTMTIKIFSAANTELANGTAVPDASVPVVLTKSKA
jgi:hypothetical protein